MKINEASSMLSNVYSDWNSLLLNPNFIRNKNTITWNKYESLFLGKHVKIEDVQKLIESRQYSFQFDDGAIVQVYYNYDSKGEKIEGAKLAYYKMVDIFDENGTTDSAEVNNNENEKSEFEQLDNDANSYILNDKSTVSWFRIDYQPFLETVISKNEKQIIESTQVLHSKCHLHIGGFPDSRFPVFGIPTPKQFIEIIIAFCYPQEYQIHRLNEKGNYKNIDYMKSLNKIIVNFDNDNLFEIMTHIKIPFNIE